MQEGGTMRRFFLTTGMVAGLLHAATANAQTSLLYTENVLHNFAGGSDGSNPYGGLIADASGALYGMTSQGGASNLGVVFKLTPVSGQSAWNETILYAFKGGTDGATPYGGLLLGRRGVLYGVTEFGGEPSCPYTTNGCGTVFELIPPASSNEPWTEKVLHRFVGGDDGLQPLGSLIADKKSRVLYGTTEGGGTGFYGSVYTLTPPAAGKKEWKLDTIYVFAGGAAGDGSHPQAGLVADSSGALYGTTMYGGSTCCGGIGDGVVFRLEPPAAGGRKWKEKVLHAFSFVPWGVLPTEGQEPFSQLILDSNGALYGTTAFGGFYDAGTEFKLSPPVSGTGWTETILHSFLDSVHNLNSTIDGATPEAGAIMDASGMLFGTTVSGGVGNCSGYGCGIVFGLTPGGAPGVVYTFHGVDGQYPYDSLLLDSSHNIYGTTERGGLYGDGVVFQLVPPTDTPARP
jgi:uncharacterized repeat protein (TIGR03803 family)